jgi:hypothetical protein
MEPEEFFLLIFEIAVIWNLNVRESASQQMAPQRQKN